MNRKGFMMAEVIVVSAVILVTLVSLYTSHNKLFSLYNRRVNYYDVNTLYELSYIRDNKLYGNEEDASIEPKEINNSNFTYDTTAKRKLYYTKKENINRLNTSSVNSTFKEYIEYLETSIDLDSPITDDCTTSICDWHDLLIYEKCDNEGENCTYAYLEVVLPPR